VVLLTHSRSIILIAVTGNVVLQGGHHALRVRIIERLQLGVVTLLAHLLEAIGHALVLLLGQVAHHVLVDQRVGALIKLRCLAAASL
jgi:hypothetical protein